MEIHKERQIAFSNEWFTGQHRIEEAGHYPFAIYGLLHYIEPMFGGIAITIENILLWFRMETTKRRNIDKIKDALKYLQEQDIIVFYENVQHTVTASIDLDNIKGKTMLFIGIKERPQGGRFTLIKFSEFEKLLFDTKHKGNAKVELMCYFGAIIFHINKDSKRARPSLNCLNDEACVGRTETCSEYNEHLMDNLKMIAYGSSGSINPETGLLYSTQYARYEDMDKVDAEVNRQRGFSRDKKLVKMERKNISLRIGITGKINHLKSVLDKMGEEGLYKRTTEYAKINNQIRKLKEERSALVEEYNNLKAKKTL